LRTRSWISRATRVITCGDRFSYDDILARVCWWWGGVWVWSFWTDLSRSHGPQVNNNQGSEGSKETLPGGHGRAAGVNEGPVEVVGGLVEWIECVMPQKQGGIKQHKPVQVARPAVTSKANQAQARRRLDSVVFGERHWHAEHVDHKTRGCSNCGDVVVAWLLLCYEMA
jgi:hypothetical protein